MKTIHLLFCLAGLLFLANACTVNEKQMTVDEKAKIEKEVAEVVEKMTEATISLNYDEIASFSAFNDDYSTLMDGTISVGGEKGKELYKSSFENIEEFLVADIVNQKAIALDRNTALYLLTYNESYVLTTGDTLEVNGSASYVFELIDEDWKVVHINAVHHMVE